MAKILLSINLFILCLSPIFAQESAAGFKGGLNLSTYIFSGDDLFSIPDRAAKIHVGFFVDRVVNNSFSIQTEILYNSTGYKPSGYSGIDNISFNFISIPVMIKYWVNPTFNIHTGPQINILASAKADSNNLKENVSTLSLDFDFGVEISLSEDVSLNARYCHGLSDLDTESDDVTTTGSNIQLSFHVRF